MSPAASAIEESLTVAAEADRVFAQAQFAWGRGDMVAHRQFRERHKALAARHAMLLRDGLGETTQ